MSSHSDIAVRLATLQDHEDIIAINTNVYDGFDYLPSQFPKKLKDPNYHAHVFLKDGQIIAYRATKAVDSGTTLIGVSARIHPKYLSMGLWKDCLKLSDNSAERFPKAKRKAFTTVEKDLHLERIKQGKSKSHYIMERLILVLRLDAKQMRQYQQKSTTGSSLDSVISPITKPHAFQLMCDHDVQWRLFNHGRIILNWDPYRLYEENFKEILHDIDDIATTLDTSNKCQSLSLTKSITVKRGILFHIEYYGNDTADVIAHAQHHMHIVSKKYSTSGMDVYPWIFFPVTIDKEKVRQAFIDEYEEVHVLGRPHIRIHLMETEMVHHDKAKL